MTLRFALLGVELFTVTVEFPNPAPPKSPCQPEPTMLSRLRRAVVHTAVR